MSDWWIDESPPVGPTGRVTAIEAIAMVKEMYRSMAANFFTEQRQMIDIVHTQAEKRVREDMLSMQTAFKKTETVSEMTRKRMTGKGIVPHCGPRPSTTFGRGGRKNY